MKLIAFDWNGTILDDLDECYEASKEVLKRLNGKTITQEEFRRTLHIPIIDFYMQHGLKRDHIIENSHDLSVIFHTFYETLAQDCSMREGTQELLEWLGPRKVRCIILSNHTVESIEEHLSRLGIRKHFADILANERLDAPISERNKLEKLRDYMKVHGYGREDVAIVGDSLEEIEVAKDLGITSIALAGGHYEESRLEALNPDYLLENILDIKTIINSS